MHDISQDLTNWQGTKSLMVIYPHPDDETMGAGGLLLAAKSKGWTTMAVILTQGGAGQMCIHPHGRTVKEVRLGELKTAAKLLHIDKLIVEDFDDGKLLEQKSRWLKRVNELIAKHQPGWIVTYDHSGISGHPDHIALSLALRNAPAKLFWSTFPKFNNFGNNKVVAFRSQPTHKHKLGFKGVTKWLAMSAHASQKLPKLLPLYMYEWYHEVEAKRDYPYRYVDFKI